jgi:sugar lactone lactonase YvrE
MMQVHPRLTTVALAAVAAASLTIAAPAALATSSGHGHGTHHASHQPKHRPKAISAIKLPDGFGPESLTGSGTTLYSGSSTTGAVWTADTKTGKSRVLVAAQEGRSAFGTAIWGDKLVAAGGATGNLYVYDRKTGADVATIPVGGQLLNDIVIQGNTAWVTDTLAPTIYKVALDGSAPVQAIALTNYPFTPGSPTADGIQLDGSSVLVGDITSAAIYRIDPATGAATQVTVPGATFPMNDGILYLGSKLYVAQGDGRLSVVSLTPGSTTGSLVSQRTYAAALTDVAKAGGKLWIMDAKFQQSVDPTSKAVARRIN